jgi:hypothetical protein
MSDLVEELTSPTGTHRVRIVRRADGTFQLFVERWLRETVPDFDFDHTSWVSVAIPATITHDLARARELARELLHDAPAER